VNGARLGTLSELLGTRAAQLVIAVGASAAAAYLIAHGDTRRLIGAGLALLIASAIMRWPALTIVSLLLICQELDPSQGFGGPSASGLLFLGHQVYFQTVARFSLLTLVVLFGFGRAAIAARPRRPQRIVAILVLALGAYFTALLWADGSSLTSAINQDARFAILFGACFAVGVVAAGSGDWKRHAVPVLQWVLTGIALIGVYLAVSGQGDGQTGTTIIFYDSAMGAIAGAIVLAAALTPGAERNWRIWWLGAAGTIIVVLAARRNVYGAMAVALLLGLTVVRNRARLALRVVAGVAIVLVGLGVFAPAELTGIGRQLSAIWGATQGTATDASAQGHISDISIGWNAVKASPISGVGPGGHLAGLVAEGSGSLYIHNQVLESWLRFGLIGAILVVAAQVAMVVQGLFALRRPELDFSARWAAMLLIMAPVAMLTAPFLTNAQRWPAILGFAAGLVAAADALTARDQAGARAAPDPSATARDA
jgi:O-antigen ligase